MENSVGHKGTSNRFQIIAIAASAGGLPALGLVLHALPKDFSLPVVIVQHLAPNFNSVIDSILQRHTTLRVKQVENDETLEPGVVYVAPPDWHVVVGDESILHLTNSVRVHFVRPSADVLFASLASIYGRHVLAVVLTGSGLDGAQGAQAIKQAGGVVIVQNEETSEFFSMPRAVIEIGAADYVLPLSEIGPMLLSLTRLEDAAV